MTVKVNGNYIEISSQKNLAELLDELNLSKKNVVVELNREIIEVSNYNSTYLKEGDVLEIIHFVGGG
ncbi:MAG: sulfur carrier protein ThiS [Calditerrivibrio sp.]|nr:sulfur carrier protein ThiS [Calditerrivibrio sp.]